jgi:hypothetical protein
MSSMTMKIQNMIAYALIRRDVMIGLYETEESFLLSKALQPYKIPDTKDNI